MSKVPDPISVKLVSRRKAAWLRGDDSTAIVRLEWGGAVFES